MKRIIIVIGCLMLVTAGIGYFQFNKKHRDTVEEKPSYHITAQSLLDEYNKDEEAANKKYLDKLLQVSGIVSAISKSSDSSATVYLVTSDPMASISCEVAKEEVKKLTELKEGMNLEVKGICTGKLMDVVLVRSVIVKKN